VTELPDLLTVRDGVAEPLRRIEVPTVPPAEFPEVNPPPGRSREQLLDLELSTLMRSQRAQSRSFQPHAC